jgi:antitoxin component of RelBE/YafQ-DinJ toxin-antitoxin module
MLRKDVFQMRVNETDRAVFKAVAQRLECDESATIRIVMQKVAQELGVAPVTSSGQTSEAAKQAA